LVTLIFAMRDRAVLRIGVAGKSSLDGSGYSTATAQAEAEWAALRR
jgi:hypothetical protein